MKKKCCFKPTVTTDQTVTFSLRLGEKPVGLEYAYDSDEGFLSGGDVKDAPVKSEHVGKNIFVENFKFCFSTLTASLTDRE